MSDVVSLRTALEAARSKHWCSFCGAGESAVALLVVSEDSSAAICDRCLRKSVAAMLERFSAMVHAKGGAVMTFTPFQDRCENAGFDDRWTCPGCYTDLIGVRVGEATCSSCGCRLQLSVDYEPVSVAQLIAAPEAE